MSDPKCHWQPPEDWSQWSQRLAACLHARNRWRLPVLLVGILFAHGRRTVTTWLRAAGVGADCQDYYYFLAALGRKTKAGRLPRSSCWPPASRMDCPDRRTGRKNAVGRCRSRLHEGSFPETRLACRGNGHIGRLRKDADLHDLPRMRRRGRRRGPDLPPKYGTNKIILAKRAAHRHGWETAQCTVYGEIVHAAECVARCRRFHFLMRPGQAPARPGFRPSC
jgi:hypothetical protein